MRPLSKPWIDLDKVVLYAATNGGIIGPVDGGRGILGFRTTSGLLADWNLLKVDLILLEILSLRFVFGGENENEIEIIYSSSQATSTV